MRFSLRDSSSRRACVCSESGFVGNRAWELDSSGHYQDWDLPVNLRWSSYISFSLLRDFQSVSITNWGAAGCCRQDSTK